MEGEEDILVQTPYMICSRKMYEDLRSACEKGARVDIVINAVESGTNPLDVPIILIRKRRSARLESIFMSIWETRRSIPNRWQ